MMQNKKMNFKNCEGIQMHYTENNHIVKRRTDSELLIYISTIMMFLFTLLPISIAMPKAFRLFFSGAMMFFFFLGILMKRDKMIINMFGITVLIVFFNLIVYYSQWSNYINLYSKSYWLFIFWFPYVQALYYIKFADASILRKLLKLFIALLVITSITTIIGSFRFDDVSRILASSSASKIYNWYNIGGYGFIYSLVLAIPGIIYIYHESKNKKYLIVLALFYFCIIRGEYTIALLLSLPSLILLISWKKSVKRLVQIGVISILFFQLFRYQFAKIILALSHFFSRLNVNFLDYRLMQLYNSIILGEMKGGLNVRANLYEMSFNSFIENPIAGNLFTTSSTGAIGGHSEILDLLGGAGLLGVSIFSLLIFLHILTINKALRGTKLKSYTLYIMALFIIIGFVNTLFVTTEISVITFFSFILFSYKERFRIDKKSYTLNSKIKESLQ